MTDTMDAPQTQVSTPAADDKTAVADKVQAQPRTKAKSAGKAGKSAKPVKAAAAKAKGKPAKATKAAAKPVTKPAAESGKPAAKAKPAKVVKPTKAAGKPAKAKSEVKTGTVKTGKTAAAKSDKTKTAKTKTATPVKIVVKPAAKAKPAARTMALKTGGQTARSTVRQTGRRGAAPSSVGARIVALRSSKGMTQDDLSKALGVSRSAVAQWETDRCSQGADKIEALAKLFGVTQGYLLSGEVSGRDLDRTENRLINGFRCLGAEDRVMILKFVERLGKAPAKA